MAQDVVPSVRPHCDSGTKTACQYHSGGSQHLVFNVASLYQIYKLLVQMLVPKLPSLNKGAFSMCIPFVFDTYLV